MDASYFEGNRGRSKANDDCLYDPSSPIFLFFSNYLFKNHEIISTSMGDRLYRRGRAYAGIRAGADGNQFGVHHRTSGGRLSGGSTGPIPPGYHLRDDLLYRLFYGIFYAPREQPPQHPQQRSEGDDNNNNEGEG